MCAKNHKNVYLFVKVIVKKSVAPFLCGHGVVIFYSCYSKYNNYTDVTHKNNNK